MSPATPQIVRRDAPPRVVWALEQAGVHPLLARLFAGRGVRSPDELDPALERLLAPPTLRGTDAAARLLADAIAERRRICVIADYDCDGATACTVALRGLALLGAAPGTLGYVVPDRAVHGYGLTPAIVDLAREQRPDLLMTVDNGIASLDGVAHARRHGLAVVVTDHHLPALVDGRVVLPDADVIVNPNQPACAFESKSLAGVGVAFYVLLALRAELRRRGVFGAGDGAPPQPRLDTLLDLVALGTVADVVKLDVNNRRLVAQGLKRIRAGRMQPGVAALFRVAGRDPARACAFDLGFALGPRVNAAGRLADMTLGIECLLTDDPARADELAVLLDGINRERRSIEGGMNAQAELHLAEAVARQAGAALEAGATPPAVAIFDDSFHEGVVGIVASRVKERLHRPTFVFARGKDGLLKGSGRSIAGFHLRDALDLVSKRHPELLKRFGGHAMAAGCTVAADGFATFEAALREVAREWLAPAALTRTLLSDGPLGVEHFNAETIRRLDDQVWGQAFEGPLFSAEADVVAQRLVAEKHLKLTLRVDGTLREAIWFGRCEPIGERVRVAYRLTVDSYNGVERVQMVVEAAF
ncbi:single-stranded-DNA-specific exonuclease RecJ [Piscinibacter koreensis]|uniref:Single-stranded-DNA-specific exonuclease RecJ n=1 Tax=Piscinibacter koreensis TaxID=2742824 RepID=A0A7Y6NLM0_9BURK|nr:single-stranded-DNA-specific exonuclease RecJ [Schlegelella koreensis]NUZ05394.1 single-stranded-DNA-specific exonuclease RecJ [Schlegelella koreensis]